MHGLNKDFAEALAREEWRDARHLRKVAQAAPTKVLQMSVPASMKHAWDARAASLGVRPRDVLLALHQLVDEDPEVADRLAAVMRRGEYLTRWGSGDGERA